LDKKLAGVGRLNSFMVHLTDHQTFQMVACVSPAVTAAEACPGSAWSLSDN